ncbi:MAG TPA: hypothetical protein VFR35_03670 [Actinoplanes sp.]|nr:hypothetical protein [Actinoplanes sp.]
MSRTSLNHRSADRADLPVGATGGHPPSRISIAVLVVSILTAVWAAAMLTPFGRIGYYYLFLYAEYYTGVLTLVSLSITIMVGLVATDRLVLSIRQRVLLQSAHRTSGVIAVASLLVHIWTKAIEQHIRVIDIFVPFVAPYNTVYVGLGTLSGWIMMLIMWSGLARARFIGKPWMWRSIHAISYLMWPIALVHGLAAGRAAATWVILSYFLCVLFVLVGLAVRLSVSLNRRKDFASTPAGSFKPVGSLVPTQSPAQRTRPPAHAPAQRTRPPAHAPAVRTRPPAHAPAMEAAHGRGGRLGAQPEPGAVPGYWMPSAGTPAPVSGAPADATPYARYLRDEPPGHRYAAEETQVRTPRPRRDRYDEEPVHPARRDSGRHSRAEFVDLAAPAGPWRGRADPNYLEPDDTPTLVDIASRRARRQERQETGRKATRSARRGASRARTADDLEDAEYWRQLRGEAQ